MSTRFVIATDKTTGNQVAIMDSEFPEQLFREICEETGTKPADLDPDDFNFTLINYKGDVLEKNWDWKSQRVTVTLGQLYGKR